ncbi:hypothetical protein EC957_003737 [Mortierella hygrophila]|uniref:Aquaporin n=1 Tax=Mortierella hygrophila TaxID=979708 RepID=A0A9P6F1M0_9FUNG|nr:hypothetical protein EC957_003737 [Mortierella hygrophila]
MSSHGSAKGWAIQSLAELIGTAMYMYLAIGGADAVSRATNGRSGALGQAFAFGIALIVTAWAFFRISGAHFNPAISFSSLITGHLNIPKFVMYFIAQILGAMLGIALVRGTTPSNETIGQVNELANGEGIARGFFLEFFLTAILCFVYHMIVHEKNRSTFMSALPYGLAIFSCHLFAYRYTDAAINPARAFGTSVVARWFSKDHWIFWFGPLCGAMLAASLHILFRYLDFDYYSAGIDAENQAQYQRAQNAVKGTQQTTTYSNTSPNNGGYYDQNVDYSNDNVGYSNNGQHHTTTSTATGSR